MKKVIFGIAIVFALGFSLNVDLLHEDSNLKNFSLFSLTTMAHADGESGYSCSVSTNCYNLWGALMGSVACTGTKCSRGSSWVKCDGKTTEC